MLRADNLQRRLEGDRRDVPALRYRLGGELFDRDEVVRLFRAGALLHTRSAVLVLRCDGLLQICRGPQHVAGVDLLERLAVGHVADPALVAEVDLRVRLTAYRVAGGAS